MSRTVKGSRKRSRKSSWGRASPDPSSPSRSKPPNDTPLPMSLPAFTSPLLLRPRPTPPTLRHGSLTSFLQVREAERRKKGTQPLPPPHHSGFISILGNFELFDVECLSYLPCLSLNKLYAFLHVTTASETTNPVPTFRRYRT